MSSLRPVGRSAATLDKDRKSLCRFTFADGRQCRTPRSLKHPHLCCDHARKESQASAAQELASDLAYFFSGEYLSACDLTAALGRLIAAVARGDIKPRSARTIAYLSQTLIQAIHLAQHEYINAFGTDSWRTTVRKSVQQNLDYQNDSPEPEPSAAVEAGLQPSSSAPQPGLSALRQATSPNAARESASPAIPVTPLESTRTQSP